MVEGLESTGRNLVAIVRDVYVFVGSFTYVTDFVVLEDIGEFIVSDMSEVVMGRPFRVVTQLEYDYVKGGHKATRSKDALDCGFGLHINAHSARILIPLRPIWVLQIGNQEQDTSLSISEHSTVTYTSVSEDDLYMGSPGVEVPVFEVPPSPDYIPGPEGPPSPDYVPGPEEP
ncbi:hypothetical protein Tco_0099621 [Tanacetum coccineum]